MKVYVLNKKKFDEIMSINGIDDSNVEDMKGKYFISINDTLSKETPWFKRDHRNVLVMYFDDITEDTLVVKRNGKEHCAKGITEEQAEKIANFIKKIPEDAKMVVVHCAAGISRSGGVGSTIADYFRLNWKEFQNDNPHIHPNPRVRKFLADKLYGNREETENK
jgi:predicted protein tyrosine phosphatase